MRGRSWASSGLVMSWSSCVDRLMHEHRSSDAKKAEATCVPTQLRHELWLSIGDRRSATLSLTFLCAVLPSTQRAAEKQTIIRTTQVPWPSVYLVLAIRDPFSNYNLVNFKASEAVSFLYDVPFLCNLAFSLLFFLV